MDISKAEIEGGHKTLIACRGHAILNSNEVETTYVELGRSPKENIPRSSRPSKNLAQICPAHAKSRSLRSRGSSESTSHSKYDDVSGDPDKIFLGRKTPFQSSLTPADCEESTNGTMVL